MRGREYRSSGSYGDSKPHYPALDGLRGAAALMVVWYHIFEGFASSPVDQRFNHGYMAVDFFFILSGFVMGYAYEDRWKTMTKKEFFKRRIIRLHPMVVIGGILGGISFMVQGSVQWDGTTIPLESVLMGLLCTILLLPVWPGTQPEVRGNGEMYPLNGPYWSLFFEYIGNILYALFLHRMSTRQLKYMVVILGMSLTVYTVGNCSGYGHVGVGWTLAGNNFVGGFLRMSFSYGAGLLMSRDFKPIKGARGTLWICSALLLVLFAVPHLGNEETMWINGMYDTACIVLVFPVLVRLAASETAVDGYTAHLSNRLGDLSYPLYTIHYPIMYLFYAWLWGNGVTIEEAMPVAVGIFIGSAVLAYMILKVYDEPMRRSLSRRFIN